MMIPAVVLVLAVVAPAFSLPLTPPETGSEKVTQILTEVPLGQFVEKTGVQGSSETYSPIGQTVQSNTQVPRVENVPVNVENVQGSYSENPVLLPIQPLSVVSAGQAAQALQPIIVPAEAIVGEKFVPGTESVQQRNFEQGEFVESQVPYQQVAQPGTYTPVQVQGAEPNQQPYYIQPNEKHTAVQQEYTPTGQGYPSVQLQTNQETFVKEQSVPVTNPVQHNVEAVQNYNPVPVEHNPQVYSVPQQVQQVVPEYPEKNVPYQVATGYTPVQTVQQVQQVEEKHSSGYTQVQGLEHVIPQYQTYSGKPIATENVEKQTPYQQSANYQYQQSAEKQGEYQQVSSYTPVQNQPTDQQVYNVQPVGEKQGLYQTGYTQAQTQSAEPQQQQTVQQGVETQVPYQEPVQRVEPVEPVYQQQVYNVQPVAVDSVHQVQTHPVESVNQQQVYSVQPVAVDQVESQVPQQQLYNQETVGYVPVQTSKTSEVEHPQPYNVQPQQVANYASETTYNFGDKIPQQQSQVQTLSSVPQTQHTVVQPSVGISQE